MLTRDDFANLPIEVRRERSWALWRFLQFACLVFAGVYAVTSYLDGDVDIAMQAAGIGIGLIVLLEVLMRLLGRTPRTGVTVDADGVRSTRRGGWSEPLDAYAGVLWREEVRTRGTSGGGSRSYRVYFLELQHETNPDRTVRLLFRRNDRGLRGCWEAAAAVLGLPALRKLDDGQVLRREADDVDKSLRDLAREGRREVPADSFTMPPADVAWRAEAPLVADVRPPERLRRGAFYLSFVFPAIAAIVALIDWSPWPLLTLLIPLAAYVWARYGHHRVALVDGRLRIASRVGQVTLRRHDFPVDEVEQVRQERRGKLAPLLDALTVVVESDRRAARIPLLASDAADWLYRFIHVLVVEADEAGSA